MGIELTLNYVPQFGVHLNYVPHVPHFGVHFGVHLGIWGPKQSQEERDIELTMNYVPQNEAHLNYVSHVPHFGVHFGVHLGYKIRDLGFKTKNYS